MRRRTFAAWIGLWAGLLLLPAGGAPVAAVPGGPAALTAQDGGGVVGPRLSGGSRIGTAQTPAGGAGGVALPSAAVGLTAPRSTHLARPSGDGSGHRPAATLAGHYPTGPPLA